MGSECSQVTEASMSEACFEGSPSRRVIHMEFKKPTRGRRMSLMGWGYTWDTLWVGSCSLWSEFPPYLTHSPSSPSLCALPRPETLSLHTQGRSSFIFPQALFPPISSAISLPEAPLPWSFSSVKGGLSRRAATPAGRRVGPSFFLERWPRLAAFLSWRALLLSRRSCLHDWLFPSSGNLSANFPHLHSGFGMVTAHLLLTPGCLRPVAFLTDSVQCLSLQVSTETKGCSPQIFSPIPSPALPKTYLCSVPPSLSSQMPK